MMEKDVAKHEAQPDRYDALYLSHDDVTANVRSSIYSKLHRSSCHHISESANKEILEVGCGTGLFAKCLMDGGSVDYRGFDSSPIAIEHAVRRTRRADCFFVGDARVAESYGGPYDTIVCLEVLEHIERDLDVIAHWSPGCACICSVPNFEYPTHVRWFHDEKDIVSRYGHLISIEEIERVPCPLVQGRGWRAYLRQLRWSRDNPRRLMGLLGYNSFDNFAGWFLFCGTRK